MKKLGLAALLMALATPAWAFNEASFGEWLAHLNLCRSSGVDYDVCRMRIARSEQEALEYAAMVRRQCQIAYQSPEYEASCTEAKVYIKQRWGY